MKRTTLAGWALAFALLGVSAALALTAAERSAWEFVNAGDLLAMLAFLLYMALGTALLLRLPPDPLRERAVRLSGFGAVLVVVTGIGVMLLVHWLFGEVQVDPHALLDPVARTEYTERLSAAVNVPRNLRDAVWLAWVFPANGLLVVLAPVALPLRQRELLEQLAVICTWRVRWLFPLPYLFLAAWNVLSLLG